MSEIGGPANPVHIITDEELLVNGGKYVVSSKIAIPATLNTDEQTIGGPAMAVYAVTQAQIDSGEFALAGTTPSLRVASKASRKRLAGRLAVPMLINGYATSGYSDKLLAIAPANLIAYWPLRETSGAVADNLEGTAARDGAYTGVTLNSSTGPDGKPVPLFDGANDFVDIYSASFNTAFSGAEGTVSIWAKVSGAGVWTDGTARNVISIEVDPSNVVEILKRGGATDDVLKFSHEAGGTLKQLDVTGQTSTAWRHLAITWSVVADELKFYIDGAKQGATLTGLGTWAGALGIVTCTIGSEDTSPTFPWDGYLAHTAVWNTPLTPAQILALATV